MVNINNEWKRKLWEWKCQNIPLNSIAHRPSVWALAIGVMVLWNKKHWIVLLLFSAEKMWHEFSERENVQTQMKGWWEKSKEKQKPRREDSTSTSSQLLNVPSSPRTLRRMPYAHSKGSTLWLGLKKNEMWNTYIQRTFSILLEGHLHSLRLLSLYGRKRKKQNFRGLNK